MISRRDVLNALTIFFVLPVVTFIALLAGMLPAQAWVVNGCKFPGADPAISYRFFSVTQPYINAFNQGQYDWDVSDVPGYFYETTTNSDPNINVYDATYSWTDWAITEGGCPNDIQGSENWYNDEVNIKYNHNTADGLDAVDKKLLSVHELGHAYGLAHSSLGCAAPGPVVMRSDPTYPRDVCGVTDAPFPNDEGGIHAVY